MNALSKDARGFVNAIVSHLGREKKSVVTQVETLLSRVTSQARREKRALVETSVALTPEEKARVERLLSKLLGHTVEVVWEVSPAVLAGMTIRVADWILDTSFGGQLAKMHELAPE